MEVIHQGLTQIQHGQSKIDGFLELSLCLFHMDTNQILTENGTMPEIRFGCKLYCFLPRILQPKVNSVSDILHSLSKHRVVHKFEEILFKIIFSLCAEFCVEVNVTFQPRTFLKHNATMDFGDL